MLTTGALTSPMGGSVGTSVASGMALAKYRLVLWPSSTVPFTGMAVTITS